MAGKQGVPTCPHRIVTCVDEHTFDQLDDLPDPDATATELAADLAERLTEEVSRRGHNWTLIESLATSLTRLAARMTRLT